MGERTGQERHDADRVIGIGSQDGKRRPSVPGREAADPDRNSKAGRTSADQSAPGNRTGNRGFPSTPAYTPGARSPGKPAATGRPAPAAPRCLHALRHRTGRRLRPTHQ